ncbi:MAG: TonB-dependent receptor [Bacteroidota bacterium]|nr:TonB-dependent receptor [Bacteroidota bacterium]
MKFKLRLVLSIACFFSLLVSVNAQNILIQGKVIRKSSGEALAGATIVVKGTTIKTTSDATGTYKLSLPGANKTLEVSFVGMNTLQKEIAGAGIVNFELEDAASILNDVVVVGYGVQKVTKVSGSIATIKSADIEKINAVRPEDAIQGRASGVTVIQGGSPGSAPTLVIRGIPSYAGNDPLIIVDGSQQTLADFNSINPNDIESINVLKDAATTSIYGVRGGNGVIVVNTKSGRRNQKPQISLNTNYGFQEVAKTIGVLNATEYAAMVNEGSTTSGGSVIFPNLSTVGVGTNWQDQIFKTAPFQTHTLSVRGGSDKNTYFLSAGYSDQGGIVGGIDKSDFSRGNFTANLNFQIAPKLKFIMNTSGVLLNSKGVSENAFNSVIGAALNFDPTVPVYNTVPNTVGTYGFSNLILSEVYNPLTILDNTYNKTTGNKLYGKFEMQYDVIKNVQFTSRFGYTKYDDVTKSFTPLVFYGPLNVDNSMNADGSTVAGKHNQVNEAKNSNFNYTFENFINYNFKINKDHNFETVFGMSVSRVSGNAAGASRQDVPFNSWSFADFTAATGTNTATNTNALSGYYYEYFNKHLSYFGRVNYDYKNKYLASFSARRDGSNAFGVNNKFGNFYAGSLGWVVSNENFFHSKFIDYLKIRTSYGLVGNDGNATPQYNSIITGGPSYGPTANSNGYTFGNVFYPGSTLGTTVNPNLQWEKQKQFNVGFDVNFLKNKITLTADYFQKDVNGLLFTPSASLYLGTVPIPLANIGSTSTKGVDATLGYNDKIGKNFKLSTSVTFTTFNSIVTATNTDGTAKILGGYYFNGQSQNATVFEKGQTPFYFYGYKTQGLFQTADEIAKAPSQPGAQPGDIRFADINKDGVIDANDKTKIGNPFPKYTLGWNINLEYKNFDFSAFIYASVGNDIYRAYERNANYTNKFRSILARWTGPGTTNDARDPRYSFTDPNNNARVSDRYVEDGSFVKVKNLQLGYTLPSSVTKKAIQSIRIYAQVKNALTLTKYSGFDPEITGGGLSNTGVDLGAYPQARIYSFGVDVKF